MFIKIGRDLISLLKIERIEIKDDSDNPKFKEVIFYFSKDNEEDSGMRIYVFDPEFKSTCDCCGQEVHGDTFEAFEQRLESVQNLDLNTLLNYTIIT